MKIPFDAMRVTNASLKYTANLLQKLDMHIPESENDQDLSQAYMVF